MESVLPLQRLRAWYLLLHGSIYSFPLVRISCPLSAGVLNALLGLKMYPDVSVQSCISRPPTPPPSCSPSFTDSFPDKFLFVWMFLRKSSALNISLSKWCLPVSLLHFIFRLPHLYPAPLLSSRLDYQSSKHFYILQTQSMPKPQCFQRCSLSIYILIFLFGRR